MKKIILIIMSVIMICTTVCSAVLPICANNNGIDENTTMNYDDIVQPCFVNLSSATLGFTVNSGTAYVAVSYYAYSDTFSYAKLIVKIQKQFLGIFWTDVDIGTDSQWVGYCYDIDGVFHPTFPVNGGGTYRAQLTLKVYGKDGSIDTYEDTIKSSHST